MTHAPAASYEAAHHSIERRPRNTRGQVRIPGGTFAMGDAFGEGYPDDGETPVHDVHLDGFLMDATAVTNAQFATFVKSTGYVSEAEARVIVRFASALGCPNDEVRALCSQAAPWLATLL